MSFSDRKLLRVQKQFGTQVRSGLSFSDRKLLRVQKR